MTRTEEQLEAIKEFSEIDMIRLRKFQKLSDDATGLDGVNKAACYTNGSDSCLEIGVTYENGFTYSEIENATDRFAVLTAILFELI